MAPLEESSGAFKYQTWVLKVYIHCEGCKKKIQKILQSIEGVYTTTIDFQEQKVTVTGNVDAETLIKKLLKTGKHAEIWPEKLEKKKKKSAKSKDQRKEANDTDGKDVDDNRDNSSGEDEKKAKTQEETDGEESEDENEQVADKNGGPSEGGKKKKKKKKKKKAKNPDSNNDSAGKSGDVLVAHDTGSTNAPIHANVPMMNDINYLHQPVYYRIPPPAYGLSYNISHPSSTDSYYTTPMYSHQGSYLPPQPSEPISSVPYSEDYVYGDDEYIGCSIM